MDHGKHETKATDLDRDFVVILESQIGLQFHATLPGSRYHAKDSVVRFKQAPFRDERRERFHARKRGGDGRDLRGWKEQEPSLEQESETRVRCSA